jgi:hypothetical protein
MDDRRIETPPESMDPDWRQQAGYSDPMTAGHGDSGPLEQIPVFDLDKPLYRGPAC